MNDSSPGACGLELILASASPRRAYLLSEAGYAFRTIPADIEESHQVESSVEALSRHNAFMKAAEVAARFTAAVALGCDTLVSVGGTPFGKPTDRDDAVRMLRMLSGRSHVVVSSVALLCAARAINTVFDVSTTVFFRTLSEACINDYLDRITFQDKAGAYAAQEHGDMIIERVQGSLTNVIGLPMEHLQHELAKLDIFPVPPSAKAAPQA